MNEYGSFSKDTAKMLDININTLRRWSLELEKQGYTFERNEKDQRIYYKRDIIALRQLQQLIADKIPMINACTTVATSYINKKELEQTIGVHGDESEKGAGSGVQVTVTKEELEQMIERAISKEREAMFKAFETKMNDVIESRDRLLVHQLNQSMEQKRLEIAAAKEEEKKKGFWSKLLGK